jgi:hypothetical protein
VQHDGTTVIWTFVKPNSLSDEQFESQLRGFDPEITLETGARKRKKLAIIMALQNLPSVVRSWKPILA